MTNPSVLSAASSHRDAEFLDLDAGGLELADLEFDSCRFVRCSFSKASLRRLREADFSEAVLHLRLRTKVKKARFSPPEAVNLLRGLDIIVEDL